MMAKMTIIEENLMDSYTSALNSFMKQMIRIMGNLTAEERELWNSWANESWPPQEDDISVSPEAK